MKRIFIFPTIDQAKGFILSEPRDAVFVAGVGMAQTTAAVVRAVKAKKPQLVVLCGLAWSYDTQALPLGEVVEVVTERIAGLSECYQTTAPDTGLPLAAGITCCCEEGHPIGQSLCVSESTTEPPQAEDTPDDLPLVGNTEGAAFLALCEALGVAGCEIRAVSHGAGEQASEEQIQRAIDNLTQTLTQIVKAHE